MTAFYMFRLVSLTFLGKERFGSDKHPHESPSVMTVPLIILSVLSVIGGYIGLPESFVGEFGNNFHQWLKPVFAPAEKRLSFYSAHSHYEEYLLMAISSVLVICSIYLAYYIYTKRTDLAEKTSAKLRGIYNMLLNKYYVDELYEAVIVQPIQKGSEKILWKFTDAKVIDGAVNGTAKIIDLAASKIRKIQLGDTQFYAFVMALGVVCALFWIIFSI
jgi:NADH-quinone oxidoreductase subunit L